MGVRKYARSYDTECRDQRRSFLRHFCALTTNTPNHTTASKRTAYPHTRSHHFQPPILLPTLTLIPDTNAPLTSITGDASAHNRSTSVTASVPLNQLCVNETATAITTTAANDEYKRHDTRRYARGAYGRLRRMDEE